jgi:phage gp29-like protein
MEKTIKSPTKNQLQVLRKSVSETRKDIADWLNAKRMAQLSQNPRWYYLQQIYTLSASDALLSSQINNRTEQVISAQVEIVNADGKVDDKATAALKSIHCIPDIIHNICESEVYGYSVLELYVEAHTGLQRAALINRENIDPVFGRFYPDATGQAFIAYRNLREYNRFILEFNSDGLGLLDRCVSSALFKRFAMSCWSEYCEICGIPPRILKTQTSDSEMLARGEKMMREFGAAAWALIDSTEELSFAQSVQHNGDVYKNLIDACNREMSMAVSGALIGQDTENGNRSKEEMSIQMLDRLIESDKRMVESYMNTTVIPALVSIGWLPAINGTFRFSAVEDTDKLWQITKELLPYKEVSNEFITEKFGVPVAEKTFGTGSTLAAKLTGGDPDFFG